MLDSYWPHTTGLIEHHQGLLQPVPVQLKETQHISITDQTSGENFKEESDSVFDIWLLIHCKSYHCFFSFCPKSGKTDKKTSPLPPLGQKFKPLKSFDLRWTLSPWSDSSTGNKTPKPLTCLCSSYHGPAVILLSPESLITWVINLITLPVCGIIRLNSDQFWLRVWSCLCGVTTKEQGTSARWDAKCTSFKIIVFPLVFFFSFETDLILR